MSAKSSAHAGYQTIDIRKGQITEKMTRDAFRERFMARFYDPAFRAEDDSLARLVYACPAHHRSLETACRRCGYEAPYVASVRLLEAPYRCAYCRARYGGQGWTPNKRNR